MAKELAKQESGGAVVPDYLAGYTGPTGAEDISNEDVSIPRLKLAQAMTPEVKAGTVKDGDIFLNITGEVLAAAGEELRFTPLATGKEFILWSPDRSEGILARAFRVFHGGEAKYEWDKQHESFDVKFPNGPKVTWETERFVSDNDMNKFGTAIPGDPESKPAATAHHNYVVALPDHGGMVVAVSLSRSQEKRAKDLNALLKLSEVPIFARVFKLRAEAEKKGNDEYFNFKFSVDGFVEEADSFAKYKDLSEGFKDRGFKVDQSNDDGDVAEEGTSI